MLDLSDNLDPSCEYSFQTSVTGRSLPMTVAQFLSSSKAKEQLITVDSGVGPDSVRIWSKYDGWSAHAYHQLVSRFVRLIDSSAEVCAHFIDQAIDDSLSVTEAVSSFFAQTETPATFGLHAGGSTGYLDIDIEMSGVRARVVFSPNIKQGEIFNVYYGESSKGGAVWAGDLIKSLQVYFKAVASIEALGS